MRATMLLLLLTAAPAFAQEGIRLNTPITYTAPPPRSVLVIERFSIELVPSAKIIVRLVGDGEDFVYPCTPTTPPEKPNPCTTDTPAKVATLITALNSANLSTRTLQRRILDRLIADFPARFVGGAVVQ